MVKLRGRILGGRWFVESAMAMMSDWGLIMSMTS